MQEKIKEVHDYFKNKIVNGDYDVVSFESNYITVIIDSQYKFMLWTSGGEYCFSIFHSSINPSAMDIAFIGDAKDKAFEIAKSHHNKYLRDTLLAEKRAELEKLENELK